MVEGTEDTQLEAAPGQRHIIRRPRLERLLDETQARVILLVAPAGYGKTTLARQWLAQQDRAFSVTAQPGSADPAALAGAVSMALSGAAPRLPQVVASYLTSRGGRAPSVDALVEVISEDAGSSANGAWLAVDDLHLADSAAAETLVYEVASRLRMRLLVATRHRPRWATSKRLIYGEVAELGPRTLSMTNDEAAVLLESAGQSQGGKLASRAFGWPAVLGLAAVSGVTRIPEHSVPETLYAFFAEELMQGIRPAVREAASVVAMTLHVHADLARQILGTAATGLLDEAVDAGIVAKRGSYYEMHPLLADFLLADEVDLVKVRARAREATRILITHRKWDHAFSLIERFDFDDLLDDLLAGAYDDLLHAGRIGTLEAWLSLSPRATGPGPYELLVRSELALRSGLHSRAGRLALRAAAHPGHQTRHVSAALRIAGLSAHLSGAGEHAREYFERAHETAETPADAWSALYGRFNAAVDFDIEAAERILGELEAIEPPTAEAGLRVASGHLLLRSRQGDLGQAVAQARSQLTAAETSQDALAVSAFLHAYAHSLGIASRYEEGLTQANAALATLERHRLEFGRPYVLLARAIALHGLRRFNEAKADLGELESAAPTVDMHVLANAQVVRARILMSEGRCEDAMRSFTLDIASVPVASLQAEFLSTRALAATVLGDEGLGLRLIDDARARSQDSISTVTSLAVEAAIQLARGESASAILDVLGRFVRASHVVDPLVSAYRASPSLLRALIQHPECHDLTSLCLSASRDQALLLQGRGLDALSPREREVLALIAEGLSNRDIAKRLFISETTAKVHVRNILEKLDVKTRTEAAVRSMRG